MLIINQEINEEALSEWIDYRKLIKKPLNDMAVKKVRNKLIKYETEIQQWMVDRSIENNWRGLFEPKTEVNMNDKKPSFLDSAFDTSWADGI